MFFLCSPYARPMLVLCSSYARPTRALCSSYCLLRENRFSHAQFARCRPGSRPAPAPPPFFSPCPPLPLPLSPFPFASPPPAPSAPPLPLLSLPSTPSFSLSCSTWSRLEPPSGSGSPAWRPAFPNAHDFPSPGTGISRAHARSGDSVRRFDGACAGCRGASRGAGAGAVGRVVVEMGAILSMLFVPWSPPIGPGDSVLITVRALFFLPRLRPCAPRTDSYQHCTPGRDATPGSAGCWHCNWLSAASASLRAASPATESRAWSRRRATRRT